LPSFDLPGIVLPNYLDDVIGGRGSIVSIVRAADEITNHVQIFIRSQMPAPTALGNPRPHPARQKPRGRIWHGHEKPCLLALP
jgi:hypothetical protein